MCRRVTCKVCQKPTWAGCGAHVEQVLGDVPRTERCQGHAKGESRATPANSTTAPKRRWFSRSS